MSHDRAKKKNAQDSQRWLNVEFHIFSSGKEQSFFSVAKTMWLRVLFAFLDYHVYFVFKFSLNKFSLSLLDRKLAPNYSEEFHPGRQPQVTAE